MSKQGLSSIPTGSIAHAKMQTTLQTARYASWLVLANEARDTRYVLAGAFTHHCFRE